MSEKNHYDNLTQLAKWRRVDDLTGRLRAVVDHMNAEIFENGFTAVFKADMAEAYNILDMLCIFFDCEDEVQTMAEQLCAIQCGIM